MRWRVISFSLLVLARVAVAQEEEAPPEGGNYMDYGGVQIPLPSEDLTEPNQISPGSTQPSSESESGTETVHGRQIGRQEMDAEGNMHEVWQSTRVSGVHQSTSRDRFNWFYEAPEVYQGVIPHVRDTLPHISNHQARGESPRQRNEVTWIGFQPLNDRTRVFIQLARTPDYNIEEEEDGHVLSVELDDTRLSLSNFARFIDTSFFDRSVDLIDAEELTGQRTRVLIHREEIAPYTVSVEGDYLYIEFQDVGQRP